MNSRATQVRTFRATHIELRISLPVIAASQLHFLANKNTDLAVRSQ